MRQIVRWSLILGALLALAAVVWQVAPGDSSAQRRLNLNGRPNYGTHGLRTGFTPDPWPFRITAGGGRNPVSLADLGIAGCPQGFVTPQPDFRFNFGAGQSFNLLRFYVITHNQADAVLLINEPNGTYRCNDDHGHSEWGDGNRLMPAIDYNNPPAGRYDIWVGTYQPSARNPGTLYVTELDSNHP
jgi:hypothetical protein